MDAIEWFKEPVKLFLPRWLLWMIVAWMSVEILGTVSSALLWIVTKLKGQ
jgi:hypothetical protein